MFAEAERWRRRRCERVLPQAQRGIAAAGSAGEASPLATSNGATRPSPNGAHFERWLEALRSSPLFAFDTETDAPDYMRAEIVGISFSTEPGVAAYVPLGHDYPGAPAQLDRERVLAALKPILEDPDVPKLGHDQKRDAHVLANHGILLAGMRFDPMLESYVLNSVTRHDIESVALAQLGMRTTTYEDIAGKGAKQLRFNQVPVEKAAAYSAEHADLTLRLHQTLWPKLETFPQLKRLYEELEQPLVPVLQRMEYHGVLLDRDLLRTQSREMTTQMQELVAQAHREAGVEFNIESPKQLQQILYEKMALPVTRKTPTGQPSTAEDVLEELAESYALPRIVLDYRVLAKLKSTYTDKLPEQVNERTGRIHTCYNQAVAATGRLSSADPNLQNIPFAGRGPAHPAGVHRASRLCAHGGRLFADRAAHHGAPVRRRGAARGIRGRSRRAPGDGGGGVWRWSWRR